MAPVVSCAEDAVIHRILAEAATWAFVGLRDNPDRMAHFTAKYLQKRGKRIVPVHPAADTVHGEQGYAALADIPFPVDVVNVFRRAAAAGAFADQAIEIGAQAVWFPLTVIDEAAATRVVSAGLDMVMHRCHTVEWRRFFPLGTGFAGFVG